MKILRISPLEVHLLEVSFVSDYRVETWRGETHCATIRRAPADAGAWPRVTIAQPPRCVMRCGRPINLWHLSTFREQSSMIHKTLSLCIHSSSFMANMWCFDRMIMADSDSLWMRFLGGPAGDFTPRHSRTQVMAESAPDGPDLTRLQNMPSTIASPFFSVYLYPPPRICAFIPSIIRT